MKQKEKRYEKVIEYQYPSGDALTHSLFEFLVVGLLAYLVYTIITLLTSPFSFFWSNYRIKRKVYWREIK